MIPNLKIRIVERSRVSHFHKDGVTHLISIGDLGEKLPYIYHYTQRPIILRLNFEDALEEGGECKDWNPPVAGDIEKIINFAGEIKKDLDNGKEVFLLAHCHAGVSRSTAATYILLNVLVGAGREKDCFQEILRVRSCALPNPLMCKLADNILDRGGNLVKLANDHRNKYLLDTNKE